MAALRPCSRRPVMRAERTVSGAHLSNRDGDTRDQEAPDILSVVLPMTSSVPLRREERFCFSGEPSLSSDNSCYLAVSQQDDRLDAEEPDSVQRDDRR